MKPIIKHIEQDGYDLEQFSPEISGNFWCLVHLRIGSDSEEGTSDYHFQIVTPRALDHAIQNEGPTWGRHHMIVNHFDAVEIRAAIEKKVAECARPTFEETSQVLARHFHWEFEDYQEYQE